MPKPSARSTYARLVGEVAISWNELEHRLDALIYHYLSLDPPVAGFILGEMGNATKADFARFLIERYEDNAALRDHGLHTVSLVNRLRENRNILEHARPWTWKDEYDGTIYKTNKRGMSIAFGAPVSSLRQLLTTMQNAAPYVKWLTFCLYMDAEESYDGIKGGPTTAEAALRVLASLDRPQLPDKIAPLGPLGDP